jgi:lipopolysaccharide/colanic/teichoic acid biosynthesis glycosyltransferase/glycosyltransferase involved in cell wall biosynthesis
MGKDQLQSVRVSVIVPVHNDVDHLARCLAALQDQWYAGDEYEIIVVDDGSKDDLSPAVQAYAARIITQEQQGPAAARNAGARAAKGEVLAFTDSDCAPIETWLQNLIAPFEDVDIVGVKGAYASAQAGWVPRFVQQEYEAKYRRMALLDNIDFVDTYSAAYRKDIFLENGGFNTSFPVPSVEDQEFSFRLARKGYHMVFAPDAVVVHIHDETFGEYIRRKFNIGYWKAFMLRWLPEKMLSDSHTLPVQRWQIGLLGLTLMGLALGFIWAPGFIFALAASLAIIAIDTPFILYLARDEPRWLVIAPLILILRAASLGLGLAIGFLFPPKVRPKSVPGLSPMQRVLKRAIDLLGAVAGLLLTAPLLALAAAAIKLGDGGPVFFRQTRVGEGGKPFEIVKLQTMVLDAEDLLDAVLRLNTLDGPVFKIPDDPRVTRVGRWLRRWSLDELPQFWNVLKGEMSLVGPRPEEGWVVEQYNDEQRQRLAMRPGLTGPMQISGRGALDMDERLALELEYIHNYSLARDLKILLRTIPAVLRAEGAF